MIVGLGLDVCAIARIEKMLSRWDERILRRVLTAQEQSCVPDGVRRAEFVAGRIAAKEAASKALGVPDGISWQEAEVFPARPQPPRLEFHGIALQRANELGVTNVRLALTHDAGVAVAVVILERA